MKIEEFQIIGGSTLLSYGVWSSIPGETKLALGAAAINLLIVLMNYVSFKIRTKHEVEHAREIERARAEERLAVYKSFGYRAPVTAELVPIAPDQKETVPFRKEKQ